MPTVPLPVYSQIQSSLSGPTSSLLHRHQSPPRILLRFSNNHNNDEPVSFSRVANKWINASEAKEGKKGRTCELSSVRQHPDVRRDDFLPMQLQIQGNLPFLVNSFGAYRFATTVFGKKLIRRLAVPIANSSSKISERSVSASLTNREFKRPSSGQNAPRTTQIKLNASYSETCSTL